jgi:hypothetical protein
MIETVKDLIAWVNLDRSPSAEWLRTNCELQSERVWIVRNCLYPQLSNDLALTIYVEDGCVKAKLSDGLVAFATVSVKSQTKWRDSMCEVIFWAMGVLAGLNVGASKCPA